MVLLPEFNLYVNTPIYREAEYRGKICEIEEIKSHKKDYYPINFPQHTGVLIFTHSLHHLNCLITIFEPRHINAYLYFSSDLFNHSPPTL